MKTYPLYLNGKFFVETGHSNTVVNPSNGKEFARMAIGSRSHFK